MFRSGTSMSAAPPLGVTSTLMSISTSPRKIVPLAPADDGPFPGRRSQPALTKRAFFCGVVVEGPSDGMDLSEDVQDLVVSLGDQLSSERDTNETTSVPTTSTTEPEPPGRHRSGTDSTALFDLINELVTTERNYVQRLRILKELYADPLRTYARSKDTAIIPAYEAKILFGNIDQLLPVNEAFLHDLESVTEHLDVGVPRRTSETPRIGDVALHHFKELRSFECYKQYYAKREEAQAIFKRETAKKTSTGFAGFIERIKYSTNDPKNRVGLRELLMEPVQRVPRYTLLFRSMIKLMASSDPQRAKLVEADEIASKIALAETDDHTRLAATLNCLATSIDGFPPALISSGRQFIDCIDVEDIVSDSTGMNPYGSISSSATGSSGSSGASGSTSILHCTLFLFDDKLMIAKRPSGDKPGRVLAGLDDVERFANQTLTSGRGRGLASMRRAGMSYKGVVDVTDVVATDLSGVDMHLYLEEPPLDQTERWSGRPFRMLSAIIPGTGNLDMARTESEKRRFLENLWRVQARYRTRAGQSVVLCADERDVEARGGRVTVARTYFNVYQRTMFLKEKKKTKVVLHIDSLGDADPIPISMDAPPYVVIRVQPLSGQRCRYSVMSCDPEDDPEEEEIKMALVPSKVIQTIHQYGLFKFRTNNPSRPATPSGGNRSRAHKFGLDVISRNLFGTSRNKEPYSNGSIGSHRRSKSAISRSSTILTDTTGSNSLTASGESSAPDGSLGKRSIRTRKLLKRSRSRSPGTSLRGDGSEYESGKDDDYDDVGGGGGTPSSLSRRRARSVSLTRREEGSLEYSDPEDAGSVFAMEMREGRGYGHGHRVSESEMELTMRLELARRNSRNQQEKTAYSAIDVPIEETIYEEEPPPATRPSSRASRATHTTARDTLSVRSTTPTPASRTRDRGERHGRSPSANSRRPLGPRAPSPMPSLSTSHPSSVPPGSGRTSPMPAASAHLDMENEIESALERMSPERPAPPELHPSSDGYNFGGESGSERDTNPAPGSSSTVFGTPMQLPRAARLPLLGMESTPKGAVRNKASVPALSSDFDTPTNAATAAAISGTSATPIVPLSIKKKIVAGTGTLTNGNAMPMSSDAGGTPCAFKSLRRSLAPDSPLAKGRRSLPAEPDGVAPRSAKDVSTNVFVNGKASKLQRADSISTGATPTFPDEERGRSLVRLAETTREDIESSRRAMKRIKLEVNAVPTRFAVTETQSQGHRQTTPTRGLRRTPTRSQTANNAGVREAQARMEEMRALIGQRHAHTGSGGASAMTSSTSSLSSSSSSALPSGIPRASAITRPRSVMEGAIDSYAPGSHSRHGSDEAYGRASTPEQLNSASTNMELQAWARGTDELVNGADRDLAKVSGNMEQLVKEVETQTATAKERWLELERMRAKLRNAERQCELVKRLLQDATEENEIMYEAYNEELDTMFRDVTLPLHEEAWAAMTADLRATKEERNKLRNENAVLKRNLQETEMQRDEMASLLRHHGLIE